jgi:hypothetical protein
MTLNKHLFITLLDAFEYIINNKNNIIHLKRNNIVEKYFLEHDEKSQNPNIYKIFKLTNINNFSKCFYEKELGNLYIITVFETFKFLKNNNNIYEEIL